MTTNPKANHSSFANQKKNLRTYLSMVLLLLAIAFPERNLLSQVEHKLITVEKFTKIKASSNYRVILVADQAASVTVEGIKKDIERLKLVVKNGELRLSRKGFWGNKRKVFIYVGVDTLTGIKAINNAIVESSGTVHASQNLKLKASNDARIYIQTDAKRVFTDSGFYSEILVKLIGDKIKSNSEYDPKSRIISQVLVAENK